MYSYYFIRLFNSMFMFQIITRFIQYDQCLKQCVNMTTQFHLCKFTIPNLKGILRYKKLYVREKVCKLHYDGCCVEKCT